MRHYTTLTGISELNNCVRGYYYAHVCVCSDECKQVYNYSNAYLRFRFYFVVVAVVCLFVFLLALVVVVLFTPPPPPHFFFLLRLLFVVVVVLLLIFVCLFVFVKVCCFGFGVI